MTIANLEIKSECMATAFGQKFDVTLVLDAMVAFIDAFAADVVSSDPAIRPTIRFCGDRDRIASLDGDGYARLRREIFALTRSWDVATYPARIDVGPFCLRTYPLGNDDLQRIGGCEPTTVDEGDWRDLDPTPIIQFLPTRGIPLFDEQGLALVKDLVRRHAPPGTHPDFGRIPTLRFPSRAFGIGLGSLRISLLTIPVEP